MKILITGGCGFIGSALCRHLITNTELSIYNLDALTYAADPRSLLAIADNPKYHFIEGNICDSELVSEVLVQNNIEGIIHLAAESHVDRSINAPGVFLQTNIMGTYTLLEAARTYLNKASPQIQNNFTFLHVSTDEVYGDLEIQEPAFTETTAYSPSSPYSASKAASDHLVRAWGRTFDLNIKITNCSNNYGPFQFPEKLIPLMTIQALMGKPLPVYGNGSNIRDWLHVDDHAQALETVFLKGKLGETYNIGGNAERKNIDIVNAICNLLDKLNPRQDGNSYSKQITFVTDRLGHDKRYAINPEKIASDLNWHPKHTFENGLEDTVKWYLNNQEWWKTHLIQK